MPIKLTSISLRDAPFKETQKRLKEPFQIHKFKYIDNTLTQEERENLRKNGTRFQMMIDGRVKENTDEFKQLIGGPNNISEPIFRSVKVWFKYQSMLKDEEAGRKLENKRRATENINQPRRY
ncbi:MAG TPA: hypothetical protein VM911_04610 [Pyrinomonadaceae bacterium]|jgi:uncharacterized protein YifE (UPF0438 family)|nr:hypothetical protein [Pyrinomonadaceae bacterium]